MNTLKLSLSLCATVALMGCSGVKFDSQNGQTGSASASSTGTPSGDASGQLNQGSTAGTGGTGTPIPGNTVTGTITGTGSALPKIKFVGPPCVRGSNCLVEFDLDQAMSQPFSFHWRTNDTLYKTPAPAGQPIFGQPGKHYVSTAGDLTFAPGDITKQVYVQNINPDNVEIVIGIIMSNCTYGGAPGDCTTFFH